MRILQFSVSRMSICSSCYYRRIAQEDTDKFSSSVHKCQGVTVLTYAWMKFTRFLSLETSLDIFNSASINDLMYWTDFFLNLSHMMMFVHHSRWSSRHPSCSVDCDWCVRRWLICQIWARTVLAHVEYIWLDTAVCALAALYLHSSRCRYECFSISPGL